MYVQTCGPEEALGKVCTPSSTNIIHWRTSPHHKIVLNSMYSREKTISLCTTGS